MHATCHVSMKLTHTHGSFWGLIYGGGGYFTGNGQCCMSSYCKEMSGGTELVQRKKVEAASFWFLMQSAEDCSFRSSLPMPPSRFGGPRVQKSLEYTLCPPKKNKPNVFFCYNFKNCSKISITFCM